ncbi:NYN domain-containing protein [Heliophilum fasciatum]|uniref:RNA-binding protein with PIN domain n=1 Tax=Heliophilum fasciatum TaxID=35700 RepID=A0A4R2RNM5_9FIRM|nr:NYN domain-containing protein [Heliophilum fasciatum]MCW2277833.1 putative RNA-binding protein with PIN domain [Heliophilum fasciatum]TCP64674.1 hypothetical protein EDD73_10827 [Heliophilum fasciatum]
MKELILVDGYNALNAWPSLHSLRKTNFEHARDKFLEILEEYAALRSIQMIVVFDAHLVRGGQERVEKKAHLTVVFTREHETADRFIERWLGRRPLRTHVWVATGDGVEQAMALGKGACRMPIRELYTQVQSSMVEKKQRLPRDLRDIRLDGRIEDSVRQKLEKMRRGG